MRKSTWDKSKGYRMWTEGASDAEIGRACGAATSTVRFCRLKHWVGKPGFVMERVAAAPPEGEEETMENDENIAAAGDPSGLPCGQPALLERGSQDAPPLDLTAHGRQVSLMDAIEAATEGLWGVRAVCTANILQALWNWTCREDLEAARQTIDWLLERMEA